MAIGIERTLPQLNWDDILVKQFSCQFQGIALWSRAVGITLLLFAQTHSAHLRLPNTMLHAMCPVPFEETIVGRLAAIIEEVLPSGQVEILYKTLP